MTTISKSVPRQTSLVSQLITTILMGLSLFLLAILMVIGSYQVWFSGHILPGVSVAGVDLSGMIPQDAALKLSQNVVFPYLGKILFRDGDKIWLASPAELGLVLNTSSSVQAAMQVGRSGNLVQRLSTQVNSWRNGQEIPVVYLFDQRVAYAFLQKIATEIDRPEIEADLALDGVNVIEKNGQIGRLLNVDLTMDLLITQLQSFSDGEVPLIINEVDPLIMEVTSEAETLKNLLSSPLVLSIPDAQANDPGPWIIEPDSLANMIRIEREINGESAHYILSLDDSRLMPILDEIGASIKSKSQNARFIFNDETRQLELIQPAIIGKSFNLEASLGEIKQLAFQGEHEIPIVVDLDPLLVGDDAQAHTLGITELVSTGTTYFFGSSNERIQNIQTASSRFHGLLVAPGEVFSMGNALGDVSLENGYAEAMIIYDNRTIKGVGGGVCQVSTTLFRTVFLGGFPVVERHPHAYRVGYYEQLSSGAHDSNLAGLDATVYVPLVDFKFKNDTPYWLLMETYVNVEARRLTWKFYSTNDGRSVEWTTTGPQDVVPAPEPLFQENPELGADEIKQVDWSADGAVVNVNRTVLKNGQVYFEDRFFTSYSPWQAICEYGSGLTDPKARAAEKGICQQ
ncbi:MAG: VanW family protein [Chloroflexota bacterium]